MGYKREGWGCPKCGKIYWAMPLMKIDYYCDAEWVKVTVEYDDNDELLQEIWREAETWSKEHRSMGETANDKNQN